MSAITPEQIDALLPQTQCGLCGFESCKPYADALAAGIAPINLCPPGGVVLLETLATLLKVDAIPFVEEMKKKAKPPQIAVINEAQCIGCMKCIKVCPVDAILGSAKLMHTVISSECTGCELCLAPCPVNCIDLLPQSSEITPEKRNNARKRFMQRKRRLQKNNEKQLKGPEESASRKAYIAAAIIRVKNKKNRGLNTSYPLKISAN